MTDFLPDKAIDLMDEAAARIRLKNLTSSDELLALKKRDNRYAEIGWKNCFVEKEISQAAGALMSEKGKYLKINKQKLMRKNRRNRKPKTSL